MAISSMQQPRQMYGLGSFVKKITRPIKKVLKSPLGKAALLGAGAYGLNRFGIGSSAFGKGFMGNISNPFASGKTNFLRNMFLKKGADPGGSFWCFKLW